MTTLNEFELIKELGKGAYGTVLLVKRKADKLKYAMKRVKIGKMNQKDQINALNEVRILASIYHANVCDYKEAFYDKESQTLNIIMEYAEDGDLLAKIKQARINKTYIAESKIWSYLIQIIHGIKALHDKTVMHRDLKSANIFLTKNGTIKIGDLNVSKVVKTDFLKTQTGTPYYASPEVWSEKPYDYKSDIWSAGCILYELCALKPPFRGQSLEQLYKCITKGVYDSIPSHYSKDLQQVIAGLLKVDPKKRPDCESILKNPLIIKRMNYSNITECTGDLLNTIKLPSKIDEIIDFLPKLKRYQENLTDLNNDIFSLEKKMDNISLSTDSGSDRNSVETVKNIIISKNVVKGIKKESSTSREKKESSAKENCSSLTPKTLRLNNLLSKNKGNILKANISSVKSGNSKEKYVINIKLNTKRLLSSDRKHVPSLIESKKVKNYLSPVVGIDLVKKVCGAQKTNTSSSNNSNNSNKKSFFVKN